MRPYGQKKEKTLRGIHTSDSCGCEICNTGGWKIHKSRERHNTEELEDYYESKDTVIDFCELEYTVKVRAEDDRFIASSNVLGLELMGVTPEHAIGKVHEAFEIIKTELP